MSKTINYSDGRAVESVVVIWEDNHNEKPGYYRAYWTNSPDGSVGSPVIGYCSPGGSYRTIRQVAAEVCKLYPQEPIYRNGKLYQEN